MVATIADMGIKVRRVGHSDPATGVVQDAVVHQNGAGRIDQVFAELMCP